MSTCRKSIMLSVSSSFNIFFDNANIDYNIVSLGTDMTLSTTQCLEEPNLSTYHGWTVTIAAISKTTTNSTRRPARRSARRPAGRCVFLILCMITSLIVYLCFCVSSLASQYTICRSLPSLGWIQ